MLATIMINVIGIVGGPRKGGNTEILTKQALESAKEQNAKTELIRLKDKDIDPCDGCLTCHETKKCSIKDDFQNIFETMGNADGILLASPVYFGSITPKLKSLTDRAGYVNMQITSEKRPLKNKVSAPILVARRVGHFSAYLPILLFLLGSSMIVPGTVHGIGLKKGDVLEDEEGIKLARGIGKRIVNLCSALKNT